MSNRYDERDYTRIIVSCFVAGVLLIHGISTIWSLYSNITPFLLETAIRFIGSFLEVVVGFFLALWGFFKDDVEDFFSSILDFLEIH